MLILRGVPNLFCFKEAIFFGNLQKKVSEVSPQKLKPVLAPDPAGYLYGAPIGRSPGAPSGGIDIFLEKT